MMSLLYCILLVACLISELIDVFRMSAGSMYGISLLCVLKFEILCEPCTLERKIQIRR